MRGDRRFLPCRPVINLPGSPWTLQRARLRPISLGFLQRGGFVVVNHKPAKPSQAHSTQTGARRLVCMAHSQPLATNSPLLLIVSTTRQPLSQPIRPFYELPFTVYHPAGKRKVGSPRPLAPAWLPHGLIESPLRRLGTTHHRVGRAGARNRPPDQAPI